MKSVKLDIEQELKDGQEIGFTWMTEDYGLAEFDFCVVYKGDNIKEIWIVPLQQPDKEFRSYHIGLNGRHTELVIQSRRADGLPDPYVYRVLKCEEHKAIRLCCYVPYDSKRLKVGISSQVVSIVFEK